MQFTHNRVTVTQKICKSPCLLKSILLSPDSSTNVADVTLYNGEGTGDPVLFTFYSGAGTTVLISFDEPLHCDRGLYVVIGSNVTEVLIQWSTAKS